MTAWTREFIEGQVVYVIRPDVNDALGTANTVLQLLPLLLTGEEIRIRPPVALANEPTQEPFVKGDL
jgi:hypothetical protein